jgi:uncharacterized membrane protein
VTGRAVTGCAVTGSTGGFGAGPDPDGRHGSGVRTVAARAARTVAALRRERGLAVLTAVVFVGYAWYSVLRYDGFLTAGYDLGIFDQAVRGYAHFRAPIVPLRGPGLNIWADHVHPVIALAAPLYWIWDSPVVLVVLQAALVAVSLPVVHAFARRRLGPRASLAVTAGYALGWPLQGLADFDFHEIAFGVPLLAAAIDALDRRDDRTLLVCSALLLAVREDLGVVVAILGLLRMLRPPRRMLGFGMAVVGAATYLLLTSVVIPSFASNGQFAYWNFNALGPDLPSALGFIVTHPLRILELLFTPAAKAQTWLYLLAPLGFLSLRSPYAVVAVPLLAERFLNSRENLWTTYFHYNCLPWAVLFLAMLDGGARLGMWSRPALRRVVVVCVALVPVVLAAFDPGPPHVFRRMIDGSAFATSARLRAQGAAVAHVPPGVCVSADDRIASHLTSRDRVTLYGIASHRTDYVVLDLSQKWIGSYLGRPLARPPDALTQVRAAGFVQTFRQGPVVVLRSPTYTGPTPGCAP